MTEDKKLPVIYTVMPDEIRNKHPHGQFVFDRPGLVINFACEIEEDTNSPIIEPMARRLAEFLAGDEPFMVFPTPHTGHDAYLYRAPAAHIVLVHAAWSEKTVVRPRPNGPVEYRDNETGMPLVLKKRDS